jgi:hypothetical protein
VLLHSGAEGRGVFADSDKCLGLDELETSQVSMGNEEENQNGPISDP